MKTASKILVTGLAALTLLSACSDLEVEEPREIYDKDVRDPNDPTKERSKIGDLFEYNREEAPGGGGNLNVNKYLWLASLNTVEFLPLTSTDPFSGVIATDWGVTPGDQNERFKIVVYIDSPQLVVSSLKVAVYRQVKNNAGDWVSAAVDPQTPRKIEDAILTRARQIKVAELNNDRNVQPPAPESSTDG